MNWRRFISHTYIRLRTADAINQNLCLGSKVWVVDFEAPCLRAPIRR